MTCALQNNECCSATSAAQLSQKCSTASVFASGMLLGWGFEGWGLGLADLWVQKNQGGTGSVRFGCGLGVERFERFRFSVPAVPLQKGFLRFQYSLTGKDGSGSWKNGSGGSGSTFGFWKNGSDGSGFRFRFGSWAILKILALRWPDSRESIRRFARIV